MKPDRTRALLWIGRRRAVTMALLLLAVVVATGLLLGDTAYAVVGLAAIVAYGGYCVLRPARRDDAFWPILLPGPAAELAESLLGVPKPYVGVPLTLIALAILSSLDRQDARERGAPAGVSQPAPEPAARPTSRPAP